MMSPAAEQPWDRLADTGKGYLSVFYSERMARWPVREITRRADNKSDPNLETGTYGLFSTCEPSMRKHVVHDGAAHIFFLTTHSPGAGRVLTGYYHVGSYTEGTRGAANSDFALAADHMRFINPIPVASLPLQVRDHCAGPFRQTRRLDDKQVDVLRELCDSVDDLTSKYLEEISRVERFARTQSGYPYPSWGRAAGFTWDDARAFYFNGAPPLKAPNSTGSKRWRCGDCQRVINSAALLKMCPACQSTAGLVPEAAA